MATMIQIQQLALIARKKVFEDQANNIEWEEDETWEEDEDWENN